MLARDESSRADWQTLPLRVRDLLLALLVGVVAGLLLLRAPAVDPRLVLSGVLIVAGLVLSFHLYGRLASPLGLFSLVWEGALFLEYLELVPYLPIPHNAELMLHGSFVSFLAGSASASLVRPRPWLVSEDGREARARPESPTVGRMFLYLGLLGIVLSLLQVASDLGIRAIFTNPLALRAARVEGEIGGGGPGYLRLLLLAAIPLVDPRREGYLILAGSVAWSLLSSERGFILYAVLFAGISWLYQAQRPLRPRNIVYASLLIVLALGTFVKGASLLGKDRLITNLVNQTGASVELLPDALTGPYVYLTGGFAGFGQYVEEVPPGTVGLPAVVSPLERLRGAKEDIFYEFRPIPFPFNLYTYLRSWYDAFGVLGTQLGPGILGFSSAFCYATRQRSVRRHFLASVLTVGIVGGVCAPMLSYSSFLFLLALGALLPAGRLSVTTLRHIVPHSPRSPDRGVVG